MPQLASSPAVQPRPTAFLRRLSALQPLSEEERSFVEQSAGAKRYVSGADLVCEGEVAARPLIVLAGWACQARTLGDGRRQIFDFLMPGDAIGLSGRSDSAELTVTALTPISTMDGAPLQAAFAERGEAVNNLRTACSQLEDLSRARLLDHVTRLGRMSAFERVAHLFVELWSRSSAALLTSGATFPLPVIQAVLADALGLSVVHLNRVLRQIEREGLARCASGRVTVLDAERLKAAALMAA